MFEFLPNDGKQEDLVAEAYLGTKRSGSHVQVSQEPHCIAFSFEMRVLCGSPGISERHWGIWDRLTKLAARPLSMPWLSHSDIKGTCVREYRHQPEVSL